MSSFETIMDIQDDSLNHARASSVSSLRRIMSGDRSSSGGAGSSAPSTNGGGGGHGLARAGKKSVLSDKYVMGEELGRGAYGQVFKGLDTRTGEVVAIKRLSLAGISAENLQNIMTEIELLKNLNHRHIVKYMGSFKTRSHLFIVLEYMENGALSGVIKPQNFGCLPEALLAVCIEQVLQGLAYLHEQGVVHRDIKGANILTTKEGLVKLADFGVAAKLGELEEQRDYRDSVVGSPYWMAPEVIEMTGVTAASDIWSVACLAIELLTGQPPNYDLQPMSALFRIVQDQSMPLPPGISHHFEEFLLKCFHKDPTKRPDARTLLKHPFLIHNKRTLRSSWSRTRGARARGMKTEAHQSIQAVVERILQAEGQSLAEQTAAEPTAPGSGVGANKKPPLHPADARREGEASSSGQPEELYSTLSSHSDRTAQLHSDEIDPEMPLGTLVGGPRGSEGESTAHATPTSLTPKSTTPKSSLATPHRRSPELHRHASRSDVLGGMFHVRTQAGELPDSPLAGLLDKLGSSSPLPNAAKLGRDLMGWTADPYYDRSPGQYAIAEAGGEESDAVARREDAAQVRHYVQSMRLPLRVLAPPKQATSPRDPESRPVAAQDPNKEAEAAIKGLAAMVKNNAERLGVFVAEGGHMHLLELLTSSHSKLVLPALQLVNACVSSDTRVLEQLCLMGLVPAVLRYAGPVLPGWDEARWRGVRFEAALFVQHMCFTSSETVRVLVACQTLPVLVEFVEENFSQNAVLTHIGISCIWRVMELHRALTLGTLCCMLAHSGLAHRLVSSLRAVNLQYKQLFSMDKKVAGPAPQPLAPVSVPPAGSTADDVGRAPSPEFESKGLLGADDLTARSDSTSVALSKAHAAARTGPARNRRAVDGTATVSTAGGGAPMRVESLQPLMERMADLLLVLSHGDTMVKESMCRQETLRLYFDVIQMLSELPDEELLLKSLRVIKALSADPALLSALQEASAIQHTAPFLVQRSASPAVQLEVLALMYNVCKMSRERQEVAAKAGVIPSLTRLALPVGQEYDPALGTVPGADAALYEAMRPLAVSLLCAMAHTSARTRALLWNSDGLSVLLQLLKEEVWQAPALDALAAWLSEDPYRVEPRLCEGNALARFVLLFQEKIAPGDMDLLARLLTPFIRIMKRSPRFTVEIAQRCFMPVLLELLKKQHAEARRKLLQVIHVIYEHYPRPKELIMKYCLQEHLKRLVAGTRTGQTILVQKQAQRLLDAFQINMVL